MPASCAVCHRPVTSATMTTVGTEVVHRACVPNIGRSILTRFRLALAKEKSERASADRLAAELRAEAADARRRSFDLEAELQIARQQLSVAKADMNTLSERLGAEQRRNRTDREECAQAVRRQAELLTENDHLKNELALHRALSPTPAHAPADNKAAPADDGKDPAVIRAELLELD